MMTKSSLRDAPKNFHLTKVKRQVLALLAEYFCLRTNDLVQLVYGEQTEIHQASMRRTLSLLLKEGYTNRLPYLDLEAETGGRTYIHGLSDKGLNNLPTLDFMNGKALWNGHLELAKSFDEHSQRTLDHELEISLFHIALKKFAAKHSLHLFWQQTDLKKKSVAPDALFAITDPSKPAGHDTLYYFLEMERAKIGNYRNGEPSIIRKLGKYYEYYNSDACLKEWEEFRQFRVIVVQRNDARRQNLLNELEEKYKHRMFWLTTEDLYKTDIGGEIFATPKDHEQRSYSFLNPTNA
jgi:hypothetical protein